MTRLFNIAGQRYRPTLPSIGTKLGALAMQDNASTQAALDHIAGLNIAMLELKWNLYQPSSQAAQDNAWVATQKTALAQIHAAGFTDITLSPGAHYTPTWISAGANALKFLSQDLATYSNGLNTVWSAANRLIYQQYVDRICADFGVNTWSTIRINSIADGEFLYPSSPGRAYWAYDVAAQTGVGLAGGQSVSPFPGWIADGTNGSGVNGGPTLTTAQVQTWLTWYLQSLVNCGSWQMAYWRSKGFTGKFEGLWASGTGSFPNNTASQISAFLSNPANVLATGAAWDQMYPLIAAIPEASNTFTHLSSIGDQSGTPANNPVSPGDQSVVVSGTNVNNWSATRWQAYNATKNGLKMTGENTGYSSGIAPYYIDTSPNATSGPPPFGMMFSATQQMRSVRLARAYWAADAQFANASVDPAQFVRSMS